MGQGTSTVAEKGEQGIQGIPGNDMKSWGEWTDTDKQNFLTSISTDEKFKTDVKDKLSTDEAFRTMIATVAKGDQEFVKKLTQLLLVDTSFKSDVGKAVNDDVFKNAISTQVVQAYNSNDDFKSSVQTFLAGNAPFQTSVGTKVSSDSGFKVSIINDLKKDTVFLSSIKGQKGDDSTIPGPIGPSGEGLATLEVTSEGMATVTTTTGRKFAPFNVKSTVPGPAGKDSDINSTTLPVFLKNNSVLCKDNSCTVPVGSDIKTASVGRPLGDKDWFRIFGTPNVGTAVYHGLSIGEGGGLRVGDWSRVPNGEIQSTGDIISGGQIKSTGTVTAFGGKRDLVGDIDSLKLGNLQNNWRIDTSEPGFLKIKQGNTEVLSVSSGGILSVPSNIKGFVNRDLVGELDNLNRDTVRKSGKYKLSERRFGRLLTNPGAVLGVGEQNTQANQEASWTITDSPAP